MSRRSGDGELQPGWGRMDLVQDIQVAWHRYKTAKDQGVRDELILRYLSLGRQVAGRLSMALPSQIHIGDLESYGLFGLIEAIDRYDPDRGVKFETYAIQRIRGAMLDGLRSDTWAPALRHKARQLEDVYARLETQLGRAPRDDEVAAALGITLTELARREAALGAAVVLSLDDLGIVGEDGEKIPVTERLADDRALDPATAALQVERRDALAAAVEKLPDKERLVVTLLYYEGLAAKEIAAAMSLSVARISQLHGKAILRLRGRLSRYRQHLTV